MSDDRDVQAAQTAREIVERLDEIARTYGEGYGLPVHSEGDWREMIEVVEHALLDAQAQGLEEEQQEQAYKSLEIACHSAIADLRNGGGTGHVIAILVDRLERLEAVRLRAQQRREGR